MLLRRICRFLALSVISLLRSDSVAFGCEADMRTVERSNQSDVNDKNGCRAPYFSAMHNDPHDVVGLRSLWHREGPVRRRGTVSRKPAKPQHRKPTRPKRSNAPTAARHDLQEQVSALTRELAEAREQQTATSDVLRIISSSPGELEPVFQAMLENATRICEAKFGNLLLYDGASFQVAAIHGAVPVFEELRRRNPAFQASGGPLARLVTTKQSQHVIDAKLEEAYAERDAGIVPLVEVAGARTFLAVPMLKESKILGVFSIYRREVRPFTESRLN